MKTHQSKMIVLSITMVVFLLSACRATGGGVSQTTSSQAGPTSTPTLVLATPYAQEPAAGICASFDGEIVTVTLNLMCLNRAAPKCVPIRRSEWSITPWAPWVYRSVISITVCYLKIRGALRYLLIIIWLWESINCQSPHAAVPSCG